MIRARAVLVLAVLLVTVPRVASAASPAEEAFQEGRRLMAAGQTDEACARFAESYAMVASSGTLLNLALCHQTQGKTATAWSEYRAAARLARNQGREDRALVADDQAHALEATLARVTTTAIEAVPELRVATEGGPLGEGGVGVDVPIDPGTHRVTATAPGHLPWTTTLEVKEGEQVALAIPKLEPEVAPAPPPRLAAPAGNAAGPPGRSDVAAQSGGSLVGVVLAGGAVVLLVTGTVAWSVAYSDLQSAKSSCAEGCSASERDGRISDIRTLQGVAIGSWIAGGALAVVASVLYFQSDDDSTAPTLAIDPLNRGLSLHGGF